MLLVQLVVSIPSTGDTLPIQICKSVMPVCCFAAVAVAAAGSDLSGLDCSQIELPGGGMPARGCYSGGFGY